MKYPIGTTIRFIGRESIPELSIMCDDIGKSGKIVGIEDNLPVIYLPDSEVISCFSTTDIPATIQCAWENIELAIKVGEQLQFPFMSE